MTSLIRLEINDKSVPFSKVWVHLKYQFRMELVPFRVVIHKSFIQEIFDPYCTKSALESWCKFITDRVDEFGTFILSGYFKSMAQLVEDGESGYEWVIAKLDDIIEGAEELELIGQAEVFNPSKF